MSLSKDILIKFFTYLNKANFPYVVVGDVRGLPDKIEGDIDLVFPQDRLDDAAKLFRQFAGEFNITIVQAIQHETNAFSIRLAWQINYQVHGLQLDYCGDFIRNARMYISSLELLLRPDRVQFGPKKLNYFNIPAPRQAFIYYLSKRLDKKEFTSENVSYLNSIWKMAPDECKKAFLSIWRDKDLKEIELLLADDAVRLHESTIEILLQGLHANRGLNLTILFGEFLRRVNRVLQPTGILIAVLGPDGSGKSTVIDGMRNQVDGVVLPNMHYQHMRPSLFLKKPQNIEADTDPHGEVPYGPIISFLKLIYLVADYSLGYVIQTIPKLQRSTLVIYDRYYHDLIVDPRRARYGGPSWLVRLFGVFIPKPEIMFILNANSETIFARKQEVTAQECERQVLAYRKLADDYPFAILIDANQPVPEVIEQANRALMNKLALRQALRDEG